jgi:hypothetical protein
MKKSSVALIAGCLFAVCSLALVDLQASGSAQMARVAMSAEAVVIGQFDSPPTAPPHRI